jgi:dCTP deaminase
MILTDREIKISLDRRSIVIDPRPADLAFSSTSVDLTLDENLSVYKELADGIETAVDPTAPGFDHDVAIAAFTESTKIGPEGFLLKPDKLVLAWTREYVNLPHHARVAARIEGKSSLARLGLAVHVTAPIIHAGFDGRIRLEMVHHGRVPIRLRAGMRLCQLVFEQTLGTPEKAYQGRFSGQEPGTRG